MDKESICQTLTFGRSLNGKTFSGKKHKITLPKIKETSSTTRKKFVMRFEEVLLERSKGKEVALALSGGKDSRTILALLLKLAIKPICVTYSYREDDPEVKIAKKICNRFNLEHEFIPLKPEMYFKPSNAKKLMKLTDGYPIYFDIMHMYDIKDKLKFDIIYSGNLMTEYMDTAEYRLYEGRDVRKALCGKETIIDFIEDKYFKKAISSLRQFYEKPEDKVIIERMVERHIQLEIMKKFINWDYPILDDELLSLLFSLPLKERTGSKLTRRILRDEYPKLYHIPTGRSPLSLRYPLIIHQAYQKVSKRNIAKGLENRLETFFGDEGMELPFEFLDKEKIQNFLTQQQGRDYRIGQERLLNLYYWNKK